MNVYLCSMQQILDNQQIQQKIVRLGHQLLEATFDQQEVFIGGIAGNGFVLAQKLSETLRANSDMQIHCFEIQLNKDEPFQCPLFTSKLEEYLFSLPAVMKPVAS